MSVVANALFQALAMGLQYGNLALGATTGTTKAWVSFGLALAQAAVGLRAHYLNPDGTNAAAPYVKK